MNRIKRKTKFSDLIILLARSCIWSIFRIIYLFIIHPILSSSES